MARRHKNTEEDSKFQTHFSKELADMEILKKEALEQAQARAKAVQERIKVEQERTKKQPFWKRSKEEKKHFNRIVEAEKNLNQTEGE